MVLATASVVQAQDGDAQADARRQFTQGEQAYRVGNYDEAVELWQRAYSMDPRPRIQYNLSQAFERLGKADVLGKLGELGIGLHLRDQLLLHRLEARAIGGATCRERGLRLV